MLLHTFVLLRRLLSPLASIVMEVSPSDEYKNENVYVSWASSGCLGSAYRARVNSERFLKRKLRKVSACSSQ